ncbi:RNA polymerase sigma factor RpoE [Solemya pervernicosa gill symbiont]|uniref:RNA polymerase sigma factor n=2 Tax=Gammaproteobacteria incertae sedis TaxID=118884 RepID=A0A1T2LAA9_9GAMM|nr:RNA polymerase sigma factor RpoE [Candidatus Reidiella endopervernicosa]OOZ42021.1 RNA polymerase sigma factor RpoE [Solemya pervernicosa gill symbiont]QKQ27037.1 RNA polymerase sigma factor RpoE [Candidatus Reidiella endopervernicosa]
MGSQATDQELVVRVQEGDKRAFDLLVLKYQQRIIKLISRYIKDQSEVLDVTQEAFIKAYRAIAKFRGDSAFYTWLYRIAINTAKNYLVSRGRRPPSSDIDADEIEKIDAPATMRDGDSPEALAMRDEVMQTVSTTIERLPEELRTAILLRELEGMSYEEIAQTMECPVGTVRSRIFRAREAIDKQLRELEK